MQNNYNAICANASTSLLRTLVNARNARYALIASVQAQQVAHYALTLTTYKR